MEVGEIYQTETLHVVGKYNNGNNIVGFEHPFAIIKKDRSDIWGVMLTHGNFENNVPMKKEHFKEGYIFEFHDENYEKGITQMVKLFLDKSIITRENLKSDIKGYLTEEGLAFIHERINELGWMPTNWREYKETLPK